MERDAFLEKMKKDIGFNPSEKDKQITDLAEKFYNRLRGGKVKKDLTQTLAPYIHQVLPELSMIQAIELIMTVHTLVGTVLSYLVEDGLIKEE